MLQPIFRRVPRNELEVFMCSSGAQAWLRSIHHYIFLADPRTEHAIQVEEPKADNGAIVQLSLDSTMHIETVRGISTDNTGTQRVAGV